MLPDLHDGDGRGSLLVAWVVPPRSAPGPGPAGLPSWCWLGGCGSALAGMRFIVMLEVIFLSVK